MAKRILFQGDSITDVGRDRNNFYGLGRGYACMAAASLGLDNPGEYEFINRGIGGDRIVDVYARIKRDFINLKPDYASLLIGVNDTWHEVNIENGVDTAKFEKIYSMMLDEIFAALPNLKLFLIAPYVLEGSGTCSSEEQPNKWEFFKADVAEKAEAVKRIAQKYNLPVIDLQSEFDKACALAPNEYWAYDGVHPTSCGHELIKRAWIQMFNEIK